MRSRRAQNREAWRRMWRRLLAADWSDTDEPVRSVRLGDVVRLPDGTLAVRPPEGE